jgi:hypothetical protein
MNFHRRSLLSASLLVAATSTSLRAGAQDTHSIVGTWDLFSLYDENNGEEVDVFGPNPKGRLSLDNAQFFSFIILSGSPLISPRCNRSTAPITQDSVGPGVIAYYGNYALRGRDSIDFHIERGLTGGWKRAAREAEFNITSNKLSLVSSQRSLTGSDYSHLTWRRICE